MEIGSPQLSRHSRRRGRCAGDGVRSRPVYPSIKVPCRNGAPYFIQFTLELVPCGRVFRTAQLVTATANVGQPVLIRVDSIDPPLCAPWTRTSPLTCTVDVGARMPAGSPCTFSVYNATAPGPNSTFVWGCTEHESGTGSSTLTYALPVSGVVPSPVTPEPTSLKLTPSTCPAPQVITTGVRNRVMSQDGRVLRAVPVIGSPDVFQLMLMVAEDTSGYPVSAITLFSLDACGPMSEACGQRRSSCCCSATYP
jgi:hypothetical protein